MRGQEEPGETRRSQEEKAGGARGTQVLLASFGSSWLPLVPPGFLWLLLSPGSSWVLLDPQAHPGSSCPPPPRAPPGLRNPLGCPGVPLKES